MYLQYDDVGVRGVTSDQKGDRHTERGECKDDKRYNREDNTPRDISEMEDVPSGTLGKIESGTHPTSDLTTHCRTRKIKHAEYEMFNVQSSTTGRFADGINHPHVNHGDKSVHIPVTENTGGSESEN